jgi:exopolysaccharide production protein ExoZ
MFFYLCFGLAMTLSLTRGLLVLGAVFLGSIALGVLIPNKGPWLGLVTNPLLLEFLAGAAIGWLAHTGRLPLRWGTALTGAGIALFVGGIALGYDRLPTVISWGPPSAVLVLGLVTWEFARGASASVRRFGRLGDSSFVPYLIYMLVIALAVAISHALPADLAIAPALAALVIGLASVALAEAVHRHIERPMQAFFSRSRSLETSVN